MKRNERGNAIIEFALILPFMLLATIGIIGVGKYAYFGIVVANAARAGAQYGAQPGLPASSDTAGMIAIAEADLNNNGVGTVSTTQTPSASLTCAIWNSASGTETADANCATTPTPGSGQEPVNYVTVTITGTASSGFNVPFIPSTINVTSTATQRVQNI